MLTFEVVVILAIICFQAYVFRNNLGRVSLIKNFFPPEENLAIQGYIPRTDEEDGESSADAEDEINGISWNDILGGEPVLFDGGFPYRRVLQVKDNFAEIIVNGDSDRVYDIRLEHLYKLFADGSIQPYSLVGQAQHISDSELPDTVQDEAAIDQIEVSNASEGFKEVINDTNEYLWNNKGAAADFEILKDISERHVEAIDNEVQANISTPLYIGLLGTFFGVIIGLSSMLWGSKADAQQPETVAVNVTSGVTETSAEAVKAVSFITDQNIETFLMGVLIAMAGSFTGLLFTLLGNNKLKDARRTRDRLKNSYYTFLQKELLPKLNSDMAASLGNLKSVLDSFNQDFLEKVANFRPIVESLTENIRIQKDFILKLDQIGFTKMANANVKVFEKIKESEHLFQNFLKYQVALNNTVQKGTDLTGTIEGVLSRLTKLQEGFDLVPEYLQKHDESIQRQVSFFGRHEQDLDDIGSRVEQYFDTATRKLTDIMQARLEHHQRDADNAYGVWSEHFNRLNEDNVYQRILDYMQPFENLNEQQEQLNISQDQLTDDIKRTNERLLKKLDDDAEIQKSLLTQLTTLNEHLAKPGPVQVVMDKLFGKSVNGVKVKVNGNGRH